MCTTARALVKTEATSFVHALAQCSQAFNRTPAPHSPCATTLPRPPHPVPTFVTMANAPREGRDGVGCRRDLGLARRTIFWRG
jgi:hypothetical protein